MKNLPAHVSLKSAFSPEQAADLRLTVTVTGPTKEPDPSVLAVQCRSEQGKAKQPTAALWSESASHPQEHGITAALAVPFLQCLPDAGKDTKAIYQALKAKARMPRSTWKKSTKKIRRSPASPRPEPPSAGRARGGGSWW